MLTKANFHTVFLGLGSNLGDKGENLYRAIKNIEERIGAVVSTSAFYITEPIGFDSCNQFLNAACKVQTKLSPLEILDITQIIEKEMGRKTKSNNKIYTDRTIDIDLLLFDNEVISNSRLILPHPHLHERSFVILPLAEIAGEYIHPVFQKTISQLKEEFK